MLRSRWMLIAIAVVAVGGLTGGSALLLWPEPENWTEEARACISDKYVGYWESNGQYSFRLNYENSCARKVSCAVNVNIQNAKESIRQRGFVAFAARGQTPSENSYSVPVSSLVGMANTQRSCRFV